jgi:hypothetical protein
MVKSAIKSLLWLGKMKEQLNMKKHISLFLITFILTLSGITYSQVNLNKTAQSTMNFLLVGTSSRAAALGEAFNAIGSGSESMFYNPSGLTAISKDFDISLNYTNWIADIKYLSGGVAWNLGSYGVVGLNLLTVDYGIINGTSLISQDEIDPITRKRGYLDNGKLSNVGAYSVGLSYAKAISEAFSVGGNIKIAGQNLGESNFGTTSKKNNATKLVIDAGVMYKTDFKGFTFGMSIRNFSTTLKREEIDEQLPLLFTLGAAFNLMDVVDEEFAQSNSVLVAVDFLHPNNYSERVNMGVEYKFQQMVSVRFGYQTNRDLASWSGGLGFNTSISDYDIEVSYSYSKFDFFDNVQRISLKFSF